MSKRILELEIEGKKAFLFKNANLKFKRWSFDYTNSFDLNFMAYFTSGMYDATTPNGNDILFIEKEI